MRTIALLEFLLLLAVLFLLTLPVVKHKAGPVDRRHHSATLPVAECAKCHKAGR